ncbi:MAG: hypothetical protein JSS27_08760 [Planctomycetes bacterium]|nr:hypothetical protein [Planctomycetota bacterium]
MIYDPRRRADGAHRNTETSSNDHAAPGAQSARTFDVAAPSEMLAAQCPVAVERLEQLDDAVFEAIAGRSGALEQFKLLWPEVVRDLHPELVEESRQQYLRHAMQMWQQCVEGDSLRNPQLALTTMDVIQVLLAPVFSS